MIGLKQIILGFMRLKLCQGMSAFFNLNNTYFANTNGGNEMLECLSEEESPIIRLIVTPKTSFEGLLNRSDYKE